MEISLYPESDHIIRAVSGTDVGRVRQANEDSNGFAKTQNGDLFVVCDGMGGHLGGATASRIAVESIIEYISKDKYSNVRQALDDALVFANMQILGKARENAELKGMGTTACVMLVQGSKVYIAHVGDSRIYLYVNKYKRLYRITKDHSLVQGLVDSGELDDREAENHSQKNIILKGLGIKEDLKPEVAPKPIFPAKGDVFLICSDGLSGMIDDNEIESILQSPSLPLEQKVRFLINEANTVDKGKDNITVQLIEFEQSQNKESLFESKNPKWRQINNSKPFSKRNNTLPKLIFFSLILLLLIVSGVLLLRNIEKKPNKKEITKKEQAINKANDILNAEKKKMDNAENGHRVLVKLYEETKALNGDVSKMDTLKTHTTWKECEDRYNKQNTVVEGLKQELNDFKK